MQPEPSEVTQNIHRTHLSAESHDSRRYGFSTQNDSAQGRFAHEACLGEASGSTVPARSSAFAAAALDGNADDATVETVRPSIQRLNSTSSSSTASSVDRIIEYENAFSQATRRRNERSTFTVVPSGNREASSKICIADFPNGM